MKKLLTVVLLLSILIIIFFGVKINQAYSPIPTIYYDGREKEIVFLNSDNTDLFSELKDIMPGDIKEQEILFKLENIKADTKIFLKIEGNEENKLPDGVNVKVLLNDNELSERNEFIELGTFSKDEELKLKVIVEVDKEVGNEIENLEQNMSWNVLIQENEESNTNEIGSSSNSNTSQEADNDNLIEVPYTYDNSNIILYILICIISFIIMIYSIIKLRKESKK